MTEKEIKAYNERGAKRIQNGQLLKMLRQRDLSGHQLEEGLIMDAAEWQDDFFIQFMGTPELQEYYNKHDDNKLFLQSLFRQAFMYGGCYAVKTWSDFINEL